MANLSAAMVTELARSNPDLRFGVSFTFPDGIRRFSDVALCSRVGGFHEPFVLDWGQITDAAGDRRNAMQVADWSNLQIIDEVGEWKTRGEKYELKGSLVQLTYGSPRIANTADWLTRFSGVLLDWKVADGLVTIQCGPSFILQLLAPFPDIRLALTDFPEIPDENVDLYAPVGPYGTHDSWGFGSSGVATNDGQITPVYVGEYTETNLEDEEITGSKYIIGLGRIKRIKDVYGDGLHLTPSSWDTQEIYEETNGTTYSRVMFKTNKSENAITVDLEGYETVGDGSGTLITNPAEQIKHFVVNFLIGRYRTGLWLADSTAPIDLTYNSDAATYLGLKRIPAGYYGGRYIEATEERDLGINELDSWTASMEMKSLTTLGGKTAFGADDFDDPGDVLLLPWFRWQLHELNSGPLTPTYPSLDAAKRLIVEMSHSHALGAFTEKLSVNSQKAQNESADAIQQVWGPGHI